MTSVAATFDVQKIRADFPILQREINGQPLVYLDNAATTQKPQSVIDALSGYYSHSNSNIHRGVHQLAVEATEQYEAARETTRNFLNAGSIEEINFVRGTTEGINLIAYAWGQSIKQGDEIIISEMEHHSNIVPWQMLCDRKGAVLKVIPINNKGELIMEEYEKLLSPKTKLVSVVHVSNSLGTINPVKEIVRLAHQQGAVVLIDGAQAAPHMAVDVQDLDCDFYVCSGHKIFGPTGIGVLYGRKSIMEAVPPFHGGGEMIKHVSFENTTYNELPYKFEAGTPNIADAIAMKTAMDYVHEVGYENIWVHEEALLHYGTELLSEIEGLRIIGTADRKASVISFVIEGIHPYDISTILNQLGIAIRVGHHCCQPVMQHFKLEGTCRASFAFYNTKEEVDALAKGIERAKRMLS